MLHKTEDEKGKKKPSEHDGRRYHPSNFMTVDLSSKPMAIKKCLIITIQVITYERNSCSILE